MGTAVFAAALSGYSPIEAQTTATLELGGSVVEYDGFLVSGAALVAPSLRHDTPNLTVGAQGAWVLFESGSSVLQGTAAAAWRTPPRGKWRAEFSGSMGASKYADTQGFGHVLGRARAHFRDGPQGAWFGAGTGQSFGDSTETPIELGVGVWGVRSPIAFAGTITSSWLDDGSYVDVVGTARWSQGTLQLDGQLGARAARDGFGRGAYGEVTALVAFAETLQLALSGGRYPADPVRGVVGAEYVTVGLRIALTPARPDLVPTIAEAMVQAADRLAESNYGSSARVEVVSTNGQRTLRVLVASAQSIELMGDFTDWQPVLLRQVRMGTWETLTGIPPGVHRLNIRVDGGPWLVPRGTRLEETEFGGAVGVVVVP